MYQLTKLYLKLFCLKAKPEELPYSKMLFVLLIFIAFILKNIANISFVNVLSRYAAEAEVASPELNFWTSSLIVMISLLLMWACVYAILSFYKLSNRTVQVMSAMIGIDIILTALFFVWTIILYLAPTPLPVNSLIAWGLVLSFIGLLYWQFMIYIHIFANSISIPILQAGIFALLYMLIQHNVAEWLIEILVG